MIADREADRRGSAPPPRRRIARRGARRPVEFETPANPKMDMGVWYVSVSPASLIVPLADE